MATSLPKATMALQRAYHAAQSLDSLKTSADLLMQIHRSRTPRSILALSIATLLAAHSAEAANGTWTFLNAGNASGSWGTATNWSSNPTIPGSAADDIIDFSTLDITADSTITLDGARTAGTIVFGDATTQTNNWILNTGTAGPLTLAVTSGTPTINVANQTATIGALLAGMQGFQKSGPGTLVLSNTGNTILGNVAINGGTLTTSANQAGNTTGQLGANNFAGRTVTVNSGATLSILGNNLLGGSGQLLANTPALIINGGTVTSNNYNVVGNITLNGATLTQTTTSTGTYQGLEFNGGTVSVTGSAASTISSTTATSGMHLGGGTTNTFDVADVTGSSATDLTVSALLRDGSGDRSGAGSLVKTGAGTMVLSNANTFTGTTKVVAGSLVLTNSSALGGSTVAAGGTGLAFDQSVGSHAFTFGGLTGSNNLVLADNAGSPNAVALTVGGNNASTIYSGVLSGAGSLIKTGTGSLILSGNNTFTGGVTVANTGALIVSSIGNTGNSGNLGTNGTINIGSAGTLGALTYLGSGETTDRVLNFSGTTGGATVNASGTGLLRFSSNTTTTGAGDKGIFFGGVGSGQLDGTIANNGGLLNITKQDGGTWTLAGNIQTSSGGSPSALTVNGGTLNLGGTNTYTGTTAVNNAGTTLNLTGSLTSAITVGSGAILTGTNSTTGNITFSAGSGILASPVGSNAVQGANVTAAATTNIYVAGAPTGATQTVDVVRFTGTAPTIANFSAQTNYRSGSIANAGSKITLAYQAEAKTWSSSSGGTWDLNSSTPWSGGSDSKFFWGDSVGFGATTADQTVTLTGNLAPSSITVGNTSNTYTFAGTGAIVGAGSLIKTGAGILILANTTANTYTGGTAVNGGVLQANSTGALPGAVAVGATGTLILNSANVTWGNIITGTGLVKLNLTQDAAGNTSLSGLSAFAGSLQIVNDGNTGDKLTVNGVNALNTTVILDSGSHLFTSTNPSTFKEVQLQGTGNNENRGAIRLANTLNAPVTLLGSTTIGTEGGTINGTVTGTATAGNTQTLTFGTTNSTGNGIVTGAISDGANGGNVALIKTQGGTVTLAGSNTYTGTTTVNAGVLNLDYTTNNTSKLADAATLTLAGGAVRLTGGTHTEAVGSTTLTLATKSSISQSAGTSILSLGTITRNAGSALTMEASGIATTSNGTASTVLTDTSTGAAYATVGGADWAAKDGSNSAIVGLSALGGYTSFGTGTVTLTGNADLSSSVAGSYTLGADSNPTTVRNIGAAANTLALGGFKLATGGILTTQNLTISGGGSLTAAVAGGELVLNQTANTTTISAAIANNTSASSLTKTGAGTVLFANATAQTYTGMTYVDQGTLQLGGDTGGGFAGVATSGFQVASGATLVLGSGTLSASQSITGAGNFTKAGGFLVSGTINGTNNNYTGSTNINVNTLTLGSGGVINGTSSIAISGINSAALANNGSITTVGGLTVSGGSSASAGIVNNGNASGTTPGTFNASSISLSASDLTAAGVAHGGQFTNNTGSTVGVTGTITVNGEGSNFAGGTVTAAGSTFTNAGTVTAATLTLNNSSTADTVAHQGGTYTQTGGAATLSGGLNLVSAGSSGTPIAVGAAGNDTAFNLSGGSFTAASAGLNGTTAISGTSSLNVSGTFFVGEGAAGRMGNINQSGGTVNLTTTTADAIRLAHWGTETSTYALSGGTLNATGVDTIVGYDGNGVLNISGGTANLKGIRMMNSAANGTRGGTGTLTLTGGTLNIGADGISGGGSGAKTVNLGAGTVGAIGSNWSSSLPMTLTDTAVGTTVAAFDSTAPATGRNITLSGVLGGVGKLLKTGAGDLILSGANTYGGGTSLNAGVLRVSTSDSALGSGALTFGGNATLATASGGGARTLTNNILLSAGITGSLDSGFAALTLNGQISGTGNLATTSIGTITLGGINTYTGNTNVGAGSGLTLADNAALKFAIGSNGVSNKVLGTGTLTLNGDFTFDLSIASTNIGDSWLIVDNANLSETFGSTFTITGFTDNLDNTWTGNANGAAYTFSETTGVLTVVPEPSAMIALGGGAALLLGLRRRPRRVS